MSNISKCSRNYSIGYIVTYVSNFLAFSYLLIGHYNFQEKEGKKVSLTQLNGYVNL